jgi:hypothetical protein
MAAVESGEGAMCDHPMRGGMLFIPTAWALLLIQYADVTYPYVNPYLLCCSHL